MEIRKGKMGINTVLIIYIVITFSPAIRLFGNHTAEVGKQAGWLSPLVAGVGLFYLLRKLYSLFIHHQGLSLMEVYEKVSGKFVAKIIAIIYLLWLMFSIGGNLMFISLRLNTAIYPNIEENVFTFIILFVIGVFILKGGNRHRL